MAFFGAVGDAPAVPHDHGRLLGPGDAGVEEIAVMHKGVRLVYDDDGAGELRALRLVDGERVGELDIGPIRRVGFDPDRHAVKGDQKRTIAVHVGDRAHRAVHHAEGVVVAGLDDLVVNQQPGPAPRLWNRRLDAPELGLDQPLQRQVERAGAEWTLVGRRQNLNVVAEMKLEPLREHALEQLEQEALRVVWIGELVDQVSGPAPGSLAFTGLTDLAFEHRDAVFLEHTRLADDLVKHDGGHAPRFDQIAQQAARTHGRQLVVIAHQHHGGPIEIKGSEELPGQRHIDHRDFIDDDDVRVDRVLGSSCKRLTVESEQPVEGAGPVSGDFLEPLGRLACGRG